MAENTEDTGVTTVAAEEILPDPSVTLNFGDIENAVKAIDFACEQGAYKGWTTINEVSAIRNRLVLFLRNVQVPITPEAEGAQ
jgi:hypothetical protein